MPIKNKELWLQSLDNEKIIWFGRPFHLLELSLGDSPRYFDIFKWIVKQFAFLLAFIIIGCAANPQDSFFTKLAVVIIGSYLIKIQVIHREIRRRKTKYAYSENAVYFYFKLNNKGKGYFEKIDFKDIVKITYEEYKNKSGILHFLLRKPAGFKTYSFTNSDERTYPTFEDIPNVIEVWKQIEKVRKEKSQLY